MLNKTLYYLIDKKEGVSIYGKVENQKGTLIYVGIEKSKRNQGIGTKVVKDFEKWALDKGAKQIKVYAYKKCIGFWKKLNYILEEEFQIIDGTKQDFKKGIKHLVENL